MWKEIKTYNDLPEYGKYVIVLGVDDRIYGIERPHICCMDDCEDGMEFRQTGYFHWLKEDGCRIKNVKFWCEIPKFIHPDIQNRINKINKIKSIIICHAKKEN